MNDAYQEVKRERGVAQMLLKKLSLAHNRFLDSPRAKSSIEMWCEIITALWNEDPRFRPEFKLLAADVGAMCEELKQFSFTAIEAKRLQERYLEAFNGLLSILRT